MDTLLTWGLPALIILAVAIAIGFLGFTALFLRRVVPTNEVHIVQTRKATTSYGKDMPGGNTYYQWPFWIPVIGLTRIILPVSVFNLNLVNYEAYDKERVPFVVDITAFFRISETNTAAQRVSTFKELEEQLLAIVRGAVRTVLAGHPIDEIMLERSKFGAMFTNEVEAQLKNWGVENVKNIELMDLRDGRDSKVIHNIMAKRTSGIERESRVAVAENNRAAEMAEIEARREVDLQTEQARQQVGQRKADADKAVGISREKAMQDIKQEERETTVRAMNVLEVENVRKAEISRRTAEIEAEQDRAVAVLEADGEKQKTVLLAEGQLEAAKRNAEGIAVEGNAKGQAETALLLAPVNAQITLAKEIGSNQGYQTYLVTLEQVKAGQAVGIAQASALEAAEIKIIATTGSPEEGINSVSELFTVRGGLKLATLVEGLKQTETGKALLNKVLGEPADAGG